jgi:peptidoglycan glycosyltransferase
VNRALRRISIAVLVMFVLLLINDNYVQAFEAGSLARDPGNVRALDAQHQYQRGPIVTADGTVIAESKYVGGAYKYQRYYPDGPVYAAVTGYDSLYGAIGIEQAENGLLAGTSPSLAIRNVVAMITGRRQEGATVRLTISSAAQQAAYDALKAEGKPGAVVALDPKTGAILAMVSYPSYNPDELSVLNGTQLDNNDRALLANPGQPLLNRAINATYPPGSTFKIVTSSALFNTKKGYTPQTLVYSPTTLTLPQTTHVLPNYDGETCGYHGGNEAHLTTAFAESCDTTFGDLGMKIGGPALKKQADEFGMNSSGLTIPMPVSPSQYVIPDSPATTAYSAIGQESDTVTPLQDAMFAAAIANGGTLMKPYLVQEVQAADLSVVQQATPTVLSRPDSPQVAAEVSQMMVNVVNSPLGTAHTTAYQVIPGVQIAAKTGTSQNAVKGHDDAVFTSFAPASSPSIAVGVVVQGGGFGATGAGPIAVDVIKAYLAHG